MVLPAIKSCWEDAHLWESIFPPDHAAPLASQASFPIKNVIYEGIPHGNAKLAQSKIIFMLSPIFFVIKKSYVHLYYT